MVKSAVAAKGESMRKIMRRGMGSFIALVFSVVFYFVLRVF